MTVTATHRRAPGGFWKSGPRPRREMRCKREPHRRETWPAGASAGRKGRLNGKAAVAVAKAAFRTYSDRFRLRWGLADAERVRRVSRRPATEHSEQTCNPAEEWVYWCLFDQHVASGGPRVFGRDAATWLMGRPTARGYWYAAFAGNDCARMQGRIFRLASTSRITPRASLLVGFRVRGFGPLLPLGIVRSVRPMPL